MIAQRHMQIIQTLQINMHKSNNQIYHFLLMSASFLQLTYQILWQIYLHTLTLLLPSGQELDSLQHVLQISQPKWREQFYIWKLCLQGMVFVDSFALIMHYDNFNNTRGLIAIIRTTLQYCLALYSRQFGKVFFLCGQQWKQENKLSH